jgi:predicted ATPase
MADSLQGNYLTTELDADLMSTPYEVQTNWHVIAGGPSCGKTTLINLLADRGFWMVAEGARLFMEREVASGRTFEELRADIAALQCGIKDMQLEIER